MTIRTLSIASALLALSAPTSSYAQEGQTSAEDGGPKTSVSITLKQDIFFGFHGISQVGIELSDTVDLTFYAIMWTRSGFGAGGAGADLWTEWGAGANIKLLNGNLSVNPQLGILNGTLLSGSGRGLFFEGIVPNLTATYGDGLFEGQIYVGYYIALRDPGPNDFLHYWANAGIAPFSWLSAGIHWEHLVQTDGATPGGEDVYQWLGPYVEARGGPGYLRFAAGVDLAPSDLSDFYQLSVGVNL